SNARYRSRYLLRGEKNEYKNGRNRRIIGVAGANALLRRASAARARRAIADQPSGQARVQSERKRGNHDERRAGGIPEEARLAQPIRPVEDTGVAVEVERRLRQGF